MIRSLLIRYNIIEAHLIGQDTWNLERNEDIKKNIALEHLDKSSLYITSDYKPYIDYYLFRCIYPLLQLIHFLNKFK